MTPKEVAQRIYDSHFELSQIHAKKHSLITVKIILEKEKQRNISSVILFWSNVKKHIEAI